MKITKDTLRWSGHSPQQIDEFAAEFPDGCEVGPKFSGVATRFDLAIDRIAWQLFHGAALDDYKTKIGAARKKYVATKAEARRVFSAAKAAAKLAFFKAKAAALLEVGSKS